MLKRGDNLKFPNFNDNKVSTKTIIAITNISLDIKKLFDELPIVDYSIIPKKRGRKKKVDSVITHQKVNVGAIIALKYENQIRGVDTKKKTKTNKKKRVKFFRNSITIIMIIDDKKLNFKVSRNGKFQITGCKINNQAESCIKFIWKYIKNIDGSYEFKNNTCNILECTFIPAMRNIDFDLGFLVDREKLSKHINLMTNYYSMLEASFGYTGVNIKFPMKHSLNDLLVKKIINTKDDLWDEIDIPYVEHLEYLTSKEKEKNLTKERYNTFLVFHSGKVIMSGMTSKFMEQTYYEFLDIIRECYDKIQEKLE
jgi:TATA-box binding protein (TBP) (component of TFIID and TFIIIB)